jgi:hypothetical protein
MQFSLVAIAAAAVALSVPAAGQRMTVVTVPAPGQAMKAGTQVTDPTGASVGIVTAADGDNLRVKTDKHEVTLPKSSFRPANGKLIIGMTQAQLDAQIEQSLASTNAAIVAGAAVKSSDGMQIGKIDSVADGKVVVLLDAGSRVAVPQDGVRGNADGTVTVGYTAAQISAFGGGGGRRSATSLVESTGGGD